MHNKKVRKIIRIIMVMITLLFLFFGGIYVYGQYYYGMVSIPSWMRLTPKKEVIVENYHSYLNFDEPENSTLPRIDIAIDEDYQLSKSDYTKCSVQITNADEYDLEKADAKIKIRGNTTAQADKKPYKIKFDEKTSLFGGGKEKSWVLLANVNDIPGIHTYVSMELYRYLAPEGTFVPMVKFVNLYINDEYQGVYNLCDQVETGKTRVPIDGNIGLTPEQTDYLLEYDRYANNTGVTDKEGITWFMLDKSFIPIEVKSPDPDDDEYKKEYTEYISNRVEEIYDVILSKDWGAIQQVVDTDSFINGFLTSIIADNEDIAYKSVYLYLPADGKLTYGPVWDMDLTFGAGTSKGYKSILGESSNYNFIWRQLMNVPEFKETFVNRYKEIYPDLEEFICSEIDEAVDIAGPDLENEFNIRYEWGKAGTKDYKSAKTYSESIDFMKSWTHERLEYLYSYYCK